VIPSPRLSVLRLGHRIGRDARITTHVGLVARAWGADEFLLAGESDTSALESIRSVNERFGGEMVSRYESRPIGWLRAFTKGLLEDRDAGIAVHLTMYGLPVDSALKHVRRDRPVVFIIGGPKVPAEIWDVAQHHVAVGNQPHSEVAALAIALDRWGSKPDDVGASTGRMRIIPSAQGKQIEQIQEADFFENSI